MGEWPHLVQSDLIDLPHAFLTGPQSDRRELDRVGGDLPTVFLKQVHSATVVHASEPFADDRRPDADALVTRTPGLRLAIVTADCAPVLLVDEGASVIGAAHAGWRGAHAGVLENTVEAMVELGARPQNIVAAIGPCIAQQSYEVDAGFRSLFDEADERFFEQGKPGHHQFDLEGYAASRLSRAGVGMTDSLSIDTYVNEADFHSFRRATHCGTPTEGRQISLIALP